MTRNQIILFIILLATIQVKAQEVWTLESCVRHALENSLLIKDASLAIDNAEVNKKTATQARYPSLNGTTNVGLNFGRTIDPVTNDFITQSFLSNTFGLNTGITVYSGGRINNTVKQSDIDLRAAERDFDQVENDIVLQVATAYLNVLFARENLENASKQFAITEEQLDQIEKLIASGSRPENERLDIEAQLATREQAIVTNQNNLDISILSLKQLLRLEPDYDLVLEVPENIEVLSDPDQLTFQEVYRSALRTQKDVEAQQLRVQSAEVGVSIAKSALYPTVTLGGSLGSRYSNQGMRLAGTQTITQSQEVRANGTPVTIESDVQIPILENNPYFDQIDENISYGVGMSVNIPIYNNYRTKGSIEQARLNVMRNSNLLENIKDQVKNVVQQALADARAAKKSLRAAEKNQLAQEAAFNNATRRYELGAINSFDLSQIQNQLEQAEINLIISKYDYLFRMKVIDFYMGKPITLN